jgi:hypothetical protein
MGKDRKDFRFQILDFRFFQKIKSFFQMIFSALKRKIVGFYYFKNYTKFYSLGLIIEN